MNRKLAPGLKEAVVSDVKSGADPKKVAEDHGVSLASVIRWAKPKKTKKAAKTVKAAPAMRAAARTVGRPKGKKVTNALAGPLGPIMLRTAADIVEKIHGLPPGLRASIVEALNE